MQAFITLTRRELAGFFLSMTGYVIVAAAMFMMGLSFVVLIERLQAEPTPLPITEVFYVTPFFWLIMLLATPVITMRLFAQEKFSGTFETLMTAPVSDFQVVMAKFVAALFFFMIMWLPLLSCIFVVQHYTSTPTALDPGEVGSTYLGILLLGGLFVSSGCFASSLTRNQIIAAMVSFAIGITLFLLSFLSEKLPDAARWQAQAFAHLSMFDHMHDFVRGVVDTRHVVFYLSLTVLFLFLTLRVIESRRWK
jgi:ABC-2 type transport system permease protein